MIVDLLIGAGTGALAGLVFFGGLRWTVTRLATRRNPALWAMGSFLVRSAIVVGLFLLMLDGSLVRGLAGLVGLVVVRTLVVGAVRQGLGPARESTWT